MSASCCSPQPSAGDPGFRRALWIALVVNAVMFATEIVASWRSGSVSLLADSVDFFGDAFNYAISLAVLASALHVRSKAALFKAACMAALGVFVLARAAWAMRAGAPPEPITMGVLALTGAAWVLRHARAELQTRSGIPAALRK